MNRHTSWPSQDGGRCALKRRGAMEPALRAPSERESLGRHLLLRSILPCPTPFASRGPPRTPASVPLNGESGANLVGGILRASVRAEPRSVPAIMGLLQSLRGPLLRPRRRRVRSSPAIAPHPLRRETGVGRSTRRSHALAGENQTRPMRAASSPPKMRRRFQGGGVTTSCHALNFQ